MIICGTICMIVKILWYLLRFVSCLWKDFDRHGFRKFRQTLPFYKHSLYFTSHWLQKYFLSLYHIHVAILIFGIKLEVILFVVIFEICGWFVVKFEMTFVVIFLAIFAVIFDITSSTWPTAAWTQKWIYALWGAKAAR